MKRVISKLRPVVLVTLGGLLAILGAATSGLPASPNQNNVSAAAGMFQITPTATPQPGGFSVGNLTDGIVLMGMIIVTVIVIPIFIQQMTWSRKKRSPN